MKIVISGTPGTGKTEVSDILSKRLNLPVLHVNDFAKEHKLVDKKGEVNLEKLFEKIKNFEGILESHVLCEIPLYDTIIILRCHPEKLKSRLGKRDYPAAKLKENLEAEAIDYCVQIAEQYYCRVIQIDTTYMTLKEVAERIIDYLENHKTDNPDFSEFILKNF